MPRDRVYIRGSYRSEIDIIKEKDILGLKTVDNKDTFMLAVAMGLDNPKDVKVKDGWYRTETLRTTDKALIASVLLGTANTDEEIDSFSDFEKSIVLCEKCADQGFSELIKRINDANWDEDILQNRLIMELDTLYATLVDADI